MPTSNLFQLNEIMLLVRLTRPASVLDVGVGFGKYGVLAREYLELWDGRQIYDDWNRRIDGIEAFPEYITDLHRYAYDEIYQGNALDVVPSIDIRYDLALIIGTLEHFAHDEGERLVRDCLSTARNVIISTPKVVLIREKHFDNPYEAHRSQWERSDFNAFGVAHFVVPNADSLLVYLGEDAPVVRKAYRSRMARQLLKTYVPMVRHLRRLLDRIRG